MSNISASTIPSILKLFRYLETEDRLEWVITCEMSFRRARANFWKLKAELQARRDGRTFPIRELLQDDLFVMRSDADMKSWRPEQPYDEIVGIHREWEKMNTEQRSVLRDLEVARGDQMAPEDMEESLLMRYLYWERAIEYKYNMPWLKTKEILTRQYVMERIEKWKAKWGPGAEGYVDDHWRAKRSI